MRTSLGRGSETLGGLSVVDGVLSSADLGREPLDLDITGDDAGVSGALQLFSESTGGSFRAWDVVATDDDVEGSAHDVESTSFAD